jgi:chloramphenicol 3-O-phosphotransferase
LYRTIRLSKFPPSTPVAAHGSAESLRSPQQPLDHQTIAFTTCVSDEEQYAICLRYVDELQVPSGYTIEKIAVFGAMSMAEGYQRAMESSMARYRLYIHQDVYLVNRGLLPEFIRLFRTYPRLGMVGVQGAARLPGRRHRDRGHADVLLRPGALRDR